MSPPTDHQEEMSLPPMLDEATTEALLDGPTVPTQFDADLQLLAAFVGDVRALSRAEVPAPTRALAAVLADGLPANTGVAGVATSPPRRRTSRRRATRVAARLAGAGLVTKAAFGVSVAAAGVTAAGATGVLPGAVHGAVAGVVRTVTPFHLPDAAGDKTDPDRRPPATADGASHGIGGRIVGAGATEPGTAADPAPGEGADERPATAGLPGPDATKRPGPVPAVRREPPAGAASPAAAPGGRPSAPPAGAPAATGPGPEAGAGQGRGHGADGPGPPASPGDHRRPG